MNAACPRWLLDALDEPVLVLGTDGHLEFMNHAAEVVFQCRREEELGKPLGRDLEPFLPGHLQAYQETLKSREPRKLRGMRLHRGPFASGGWVDVDLQLSPEGELAVILHFSATPHREPAGELLERRRLEEALLGAETELRRLRVVKEDFLAIAAHELRTPLASMLAFAQLALRQGETLEPRVRRALDVVVAQCDRMKRLINEMLDVSRIQSGSLELERVPVDLAQLTLEVCDRMRLLSEAHTFRMEGLEAPLMVQGDAVRLEQVITNLVSNALKFSPLGGELLIEACRQDGFVELSITDGGVGIPEEAQPHIFEPFYRVQHEGRTMEGLGLGLPIARHIVQRHGGDIRLRSELGCGTTFTVRMPLEEK